MNGKWLLRAMLLSSVALVAACGEPVNKIGTTIKGDRMAVLEPEKETEADKALASTKPVLPREIVNLTWPQAGYDSEHAMPMVAFAQQPKVLWKARIGKGTGGAYHVLARPVIGRHAAYTMDARGLVRAFALKDGERVWEFDTTPKDSDSKAMGGGLALDGTTLYATTGFGDVCAIDTATGALKWRKALLKPLRSAPAVADERLYVVSIDNELNALDATTGDILWHQSGIAESATLMGASSPAVMGDIVVVAYNSGELNGLRVQNGRASWNYSLASAAQVGALPAIADIRGLPVIDRSNVFAVSHSGRVASIDLTSGERAWEVDIGGIDTPVVLGDTVFLYGGQGQLIALARATGRILWAQDLPQRVSVEDKDSDRLIWTGPTPAGGRLWMVNSLGQVAAFSPENGGPVALIDLEEPAYLTPSVADRTMYVVTDSGKLIALR